MKLRGRPEAPTKRRGRTLSSRARGAYPPTVHGPLQRLLDVISAAAKQTSTSRIEIRPDTENDKGRYQQYKRTRRGITHEAKSDTNPCTASEEAECGFSEIDGAKLTKGRHG